MNPNKNAVWQELRQLLPNADELKAQFDKGTIPPCPAPKKNGAVLARGSYWYHIRYHVWPRLKSGKRLDVVNQWMENERIRRIKNNTWPPRPIFQQL